MAKEGIEDRFAELNTVTCNLAVEARESSQQDVVIAGALHPLGGSYRPDLVGPNEEIKALYLEQAELLAPYVDLLLCETMSSAAEGRAAAKAAIRTDKSVWVAGTLHEDRSGKLRSGESIKDALTALQDWTLDGEKDTDGLLKLRSDLDPDRYSEHVSDWLKAGATVVGGCCGTWPSHTAKMRIILDEKLS